MRESRVSARNGRRIGATAFGISLALGLAACSGGGTTTDSTTSAASGTAAALAPAAGDGVKIVVVGGKSDDPFWSTVKRGVDDAAKVVEADGGSVQFIGPQNYDNLGPDAAKLLQTALSQGADAVIGADWVPEAQDAAFQEVSAKVPLFIYNSGGTEAAQRVGAQGYIGSDEYLAGKSGGEFFGTSGAKNVVCVNTLPGAANSEARCKGIGDGIASKGGKSTQLPLPSSNFGNPTAVTQAIKAALLKDDSIDGIVTIGTTDANSAFGALEQASLVEKVKLGTFDMDSTQLDRIQAGKQLFSIDQQPYMQGFLAVSLANSYVKYGLKLPQNPLLTGPAVISKDNVAAAIAGAKEGVR
jgi:simple sugar transport system substrate-binding protein